MSSLFASGQHNALVANQNRLESGERLMAFLDDIVVDELPDDVQQKKTQLWNRIGVTLA